MHSATIKYFKTLELIHFQIKIPKGGQAKAKEGRMLPPTPHPPLKETLCLDHMVHVEDYRYWYNRSYLFIFKRSVPGSVD